jgi:hypothetical protein
MVCGIQPTNSSNGSYGTSQVNGSSFNQSVSNNCNSQSGDLKSILGDIKGELTNIEKLLEKLVSALGNGGSNGGSSCGSNGSTGSTSGSTGSTSTGSGACATGGDTGAVIKGLQDELGSIQKTLTQICDTQGGTSAQTYPTCGTGGNPIPVDGGYHPAPGPIPVDGGYHPKPGPIDNGHINPIPTPGTGPAPKPIDCNPAPKPVPLPCPAPTPTPIHVHPNPSPTPKPVPTPIDCNPKPTPKPIPTPIDCNPKPTPTPTPTPTPIDCNPKPTPKPVCKDGSDWSVGDVKDGKGEIKLGKDYTINFDESKESFILKNNCTGDTTRVWGDPHVDAGGNGKDFDFKKSNTFQLADGTKISVGTVDRDGKAATDKSDVSYSSRLTITKGDKAIQVSGLAGGHDGKDNVKVTVSGHGKAIDNATKDGVTVKEEKGGWSLNGKHVTQADYNKAEKAVA